MEIRIIENKKCIYNFIILRLSAVFTLVYNGVCVSQNSRLPRGAMLRFRYKSYVTSAEDDRASESTPTTSHHACPTSKAPLLTPLRGGVTFTLSSHNR